MLIKSLKDSNFKIVFFQPLCQRCCCFCSVSQSWNFLDKHLFIGQWREMHGGLQVKWETFERPAFAYNHVAWSLLDRLDCYIDSFKYRFKREMNEMPNQLVCSCPNQPRQGVMAPRRVHIFFPSHPALAFCTKKRERDRLWSANQAWFFALFLRLENAKSSQVSFPFTSEIMSNIISSLWETSQAKLSWAEVSDWN